jgi:hypothetical protein
MKSYFINQLKEDHDQMMALLYDALLGDADECPARFRKYIDRYVNEDKYSSADAFVDYLNDNGYLLDNGDIKL